MERAHMRPHDNTTFRARQRRGSWRRRAEVRAPRSGGRFRVAVSFRSFATMRAPSQMVLRRRGSASPRQPVRTIAASEAAFPERTYDDSDFARPAARRAYARE